MIMREAATKALSGCSDMTSRRASGQCCRRAHHGLIDAPMAAEPPTVTVAMPARDHERFVEQALDSILDSELASVELVVCDDASTDATPDLIRRWGMKHGSRLARFEFIVHQRNRGVGDSINEIIAAARGEIVHFLSSDDYFLPDGLASKTRVMLQHPEWNGAFCDGQAVGYEGQTYQASLMATSALDPARLEPSLAAEELLYNWDMPANLLSWRRRAFKVFGGGLEYDPTVFCEDLDSVWWALRQRSLGFVPAICYAYRMRSWPQTSDRHLVREQRDVSYVLAKHARYFDPPIRDAMMTVSGAQFKGAIGDTEGAARLWQQHGRDKQHYLQRVSGQNVASTSAVEPTTSAEDRERATLEDRIHQQSLLVAAQAAEIARMQRLLNHHSAGPLRALMLWLKRKSLVGG